MVSGSWDPQISWQSAHEGGNVVNPMHRKPLPPRNYFWYSFLLGYAVAQWLKHCAKSRKFAGSIPDGITGIFHWHNPSGRTMVLGLTQPLTDMSSRNNSLGVGDKGGRCVGLTSSSSWNLQGLTRPVMGLLYLYILYISVRGWVHPIGS
jgi:hypothetical protein